MSAEELNSSLRSEADEAQRGTICLFLFQERSAFNASFALARGLEARGYRALFCGLPEWEEHVLAQGFRYHAFPQPPESPENEDAPRDLIGRLRRLRRILEYSERTTEDYFQACKELLEREKPRLVLVDHLIWRFVLPALQVGAPFLCFNTSLASPMRRRIPPVFSPLTPDCAPAWAAPARNLAAWVKLLSVSWVSTPLEEAARALLLRSLGKGPQPSLRSRIASFGVRLRWCEYGLRLDAPELVACPREFDFPQASRKDRIYVGACVEARRVDGDFDWSVLDPTAPLLYCSLGSYGEYYPHGKALFEAVIGALWRRDDWQGVVQIGDKFDAGAFGPPSPRIHIVRQAPQLALLARAKAFVTHGGLSSVREAIYHGVPMLAFPGWNDQPGNAARIEWRELGLRGDMATIDADGLLAMLDRLQEPRFAQSLQRMQAAFRAQESCAAGVDYIEQFLLDGARAEPPV